MLGGKLQANLWTGNMWEIKNPGPRPNTTNKIKKRTKLRKEYVYSCINNTLKKTNSMLCLYYCGTVLYCEILLDMYGTCCFLRFDLNSASASQRE